MCCICIALIKEELPTGPFRRSNSVIYRRKPTNGTEKQSAISSELQKQLEKRRKWEKNEDSQATNKTENLTHHLQQQANAGEYCGCTFTIMAEQASLQQDNCTSL